MTAQVSILLAIVAVFAVMSVVAVLDANVKSSK